MIGFLFAFLVATGETKPEAMVWHNDNGGAETVVAAKADSLNLRRIGSWCQGTAGCCMRLVLSGNYCYLGWGSGVTVLDISDPTNPTEVHRVWTATQAVTDLFIDDTLLYIIDQIDVWIMSIADPAQPRELGKYTPPGSGEGPRGVAGSGLVMYVATQSGGGTDPRGLRILDISDPSSISELAYMPLTYSSGQLCVRGDYVYLVDYAVILRIIDVSTPGSPVEACSTARLGGWIEEEVCVEGDYAYVAAEDGGVHIVDISNPLDMQVASFIWPTSSCYGVHVDNSLAYIADDASGVRVRDVSDPMSIPAEKAYYVTPGPAWAVEYHTDGYIYAAMQGQALIVLEYYGETAVEENDGQLVTGKGQLSVHPNPFTHNTVVEFGVRSSQLEADEPLAQEFVDEGPLTVRIHDLSGRVVHTLNLCNLGESVKSVSWDSKDVMPGIYFVKADGYKPVKIVKTR